jgi:hypothetical protein
MWKKMKQTWSKKKRELIKAIKMDIANELFANTHKKRSRKMKKRKKPIFEHRCTCKRASRSSCTTKWVAALYGASQNEIPASLMRGANRRHEWLVFKDCQLT